MKKNIALITTIGEKGISYEDKQYNLFIPAYKVKKVIDPTGAGDAWRAGFCAGIVDRKNIKEALIQANAIASFAVENYGTINHKPNILEIEKRMSEIRKSKLLI